MCKRGGIASLVLNLGCVKVNGDLHARVPLLPTHGGFQSLPGPSV